MTEEELVTHYDKFGKDENRFFNIKTLVRSHELLTYFEVDDYISNNTDLSFSSKKEYILDYLDNQINVGRNISNKLKEFKQTKKDKFVPLLKEYRENLNYLTDEEKQIFKIGTCEAESCNEWNDKSDISDLINQNNLVLNVGAGYRKNKERYFSLDNVINVEVFNYATTDVVCNGDNLPFKDNSFDVVLSLAVLENVPNPWVHASELIRVLKPGGTIYVNVPFLQPYHGYPDHYFNMTKSGVQQLFDKQINILQHKIENFEKPVHTLTWFLQKYCDFLDVNTRSNFKKLTVEEILKNGVNLGLDYVQNMDKEKEEIIACGSTLMGKKIDSSV
jgi:SAM-dependent methyltransferase